MVETGPKIAQKYIDRPITYNGHKIDIRYVVVLKSLMPLQAYVTEEYFIRFSNNKFTMTESTFHEYDTHFTVMNYDGKQMKNMRCGEFEPLFDEEYKERGIKFEDLNQKAYKAISDILIAYQARFGKEIE